MSYADVSFMHFARLFVYSHDAGGRYVAKPRVTGAGRASGKTSAAVGVRFKWDLEDDFLGQFCAMFVPHNHRREFYYDATPLPPGLAPHQVFRQLGGGVTLTH